MKPRRLKKFFTKSHLLFMAWAYADQKDKSTGWMFAYMSDFAEVDYDEAVDFVYNNGKKRHRWYNKNPKWYEEHKAINQEELELLK